VTFARFATVAVPLPPRDPGSPRTTGSPAGLPPVRRDAVTGRDTALLPLYPAGRRADNRPANDRTGDERLPSGRAASPLPARGDDSEKADR